MYIHLKLLKQSNEDVEDRQLTTCYAGDVW